MSLLEDRIRAIVREELATLLKKAGKTAEVPEDVEYEELSDSLVAIIEKLVDEGVEDHASEEH